jgi:hypothetical protein
MGTTPGHVCVCYFVMQGDEALTIIYSATASDPGALRSNPDFYLSLNRANVAFSRAKVGFTHKAHVLFSCVCQTCQCMSAAGDALGRQAATHLSVRLPHQKTACGCLPHTQARLIVIASQTLLNLMPPTSQHQEGAALWKRLRDSVGPQVLSTGMVNGVHVTVSGDLR